MTINNNLEKFLGKKVVDWEVGSEIESPTKNAYRIRIDENDWDTTFTKFLKDPSVSKLTHLVIGTWSNYSLRDASSSHAIESIANASDKLKSLKAIFIGDITYEEYEMSWINQSDISPLVNAYPKLEYIGTRGQNGLKFGPVKHQNLKSVVVETGGLPASVVEEICKSDLPNLEHLELWLGSEEYGCTTTVKTLKPILSGELFPKLKYLGIRNSEKQDDVAKAVANAVILERIEILDLSLGNLSDKGAKHLLKSDLVKNLKKLDLHHHYCSDKVMEKLKQLSIKVDISEQEDVEDEDELYITVSE